MHKDSSIKSVLAMGIGPIIVGQACEFDYSGSNASKSLTEEGIEVSLINSNPATIMTDKITVDHFPEIKSTGEAIHFIDSPNDEFFIYIYLERNVYLSK